MSFGLMLVIVAAGAGVGFLSALFGVGGGILMVSFMVIVLGKGQHVAEGTSLLVIVPTAIAGVIVHLKNGFVALRHAALLAVGGMAGAFAGAGLALGLPGRALQLGFGALLALVGLRTIYDGLQQVRERGARSSA